MSADINLRALLATHAGVAAIAADRVALNAMEQTQDPVQPYVVITSRVDREHALDNTVLSETTTAEIQCWASSAVQASALADAVEAALLQQPLWLALSRVNGFDPETGQDAVVVTADFIST